MKTIIKNEIENCSIEDLQKVENTLKEYGFYADALDITHLRADKIMEEIEAGRMKTYTVNSVNDILNVAI